MFDRRHRGTVDRRELFAIHMNFVPTNHSPATAAWRPQPDFSEKIAELGLLPFILVRVAGDHQETGSFLACTTQNDAAGFVGELADLPAFPESRLLRGIERALRLEIYEAAESLFTWGSAASGTVSETVYFGEPDNRLIHDDYNYPMFGFGGAAEPESVQMRTTMLLKTFEAYAGSQGNDALRFALMEALAFALSRLLGSQHQYAQALDVVDKALAVASSSIHLKAAKHALLLKLAGKALPPRLEKFVGQDNGYLKQFICPVPFERFDIGPNGDVLVCCGHWLPTSIGNFITDSVEDVLNSDRAKKIRESMTDGSYKYCNHLECGAMAQDSLPLRAQSPIHVRQPIENRDYRLNEIRELLFAFDQTCNLSCPSCRTHRIAEKVSESAVKALAVEQKLLPILPAVKMLHINPAGELFASKPSRRLLELIDNQSCPTLLLDIISNGTLFTEAEWHKFPGIHNKINSIRISIDAASKQTFERLRRLGKYEPFVENMRFLSQLRTSGIIPELKFSFTYQLDNFREMPAFVQFCEEMHADYAIFERLQNIAFSQAEFCENAVHYPDHPLYAEFIQVIKDPIFRQRNVWHDFDYEGVTNLSSEEARKRVVENYRDPDERAVVL